MNETSDWPSYPIGPREGIFAIGVASVNFVELESAVQFMFATVFEIDSDIGLIFFTKVGISASIDLIKQRLPVTALEIDVAEKIKQFIAGVEICITNRNYLMHSSLAFTRLDQTILFKRTRKGESQACAPTFEHLRRAADEIRTYSIYGKDLANAINNTRCPIFPPAIFPWPEKPQLPLELEYASGPIPLPPKQS